MFLLFHNRRIYNRGEKLARISYPVPVGLLSFLDHEEHLEILSSLRPWAGVLGLDYSVFPLRLMTVSTSRRRVCRRRTFVPTTSCPRKRRAAVSMTKCPAYLRHCCGYWVTTGLRSGVRPAQLSAGNERQICTPYATPRNSSRERVRRRAPERIHARTLGR